MEQRSAIESDFIRFVGANWRRDSDGFWAWSCPECGAESVYLAPAVRLGGSWQTIQPSCEVCAQEVSYTAPRA